MEPVLPDVPQGSLIGIAASFVAAVLWLRRKLSKDSVHAKHDEAEIDLIETLIKERDQARADLAQARTREDEAWKARNEDAKMIGKLEAQVEALRQELVALREEVHRYRAEREGNGTAT